MFLKPAYLGDCKIHTTVQPVPYRAFRQRTDFSSYPAGRGLAGIPLVFRLSRDRSTGYGQLSGRLSYGVGLIVSILTWIAAQSMPRRFIFSIRVVLLMLRAWAALLFTPFVSWRAWRIRFFSKVETRVSYPFSMSKRVGVSISP